MGIRKFALIGTAMAALVPCTGMANVNLDLRPDYQIATVGSTVYLTLYAVSDSASNQSIGAMDVIINWDPTKLQLVGFTNAGNGYSWFQSGFLLPGGLNASTSDGDAVWTAFAQPTGPAYATPSGLWVTRFAFQALTTTSSTPVLIPQSEGSQSSTVYDGVVPNTDVTGSLESGAVVEIVPATYPATAFTIGPGSVLFGGVFELQVSDNNHLFTRPGAVLLTTQAPLVMTATTTLPSTSATEITLNVESSVNTGGIVQRIEVFNYLSGLYELVDTSTPGPSDTTVTINLTSNASNYIDQGNGQVKTRISCKPSGPVLIYPWQFRIDYIAWTEAT